MGANTFNKTDTRIAFPGYNSITRGQMRDWFDSSLNFISGPQFAASSSTSISWNTGTVDGGNFARVDGLGNHYACCTGRTRPAPSIPRSSTSATTTGTGCSRST
jgi:hypothetical protein